MKKQILMRMAVAVMTASVLVTTLPAIAVNATDIEAETVVSSEEMQDSTQNVSDDVEEELATDIEDEQTVVTSDEEDSDDVISEDGENYTIGSYDYSLKSGAVTIVKYNGTEENVEVPDKVTIEGSEYIINTIGDKAFADKTTLKTVVIPERIKYLGALVFSNCTSLSKVTIKGDIADCDKRVITVQDSWYSVFYNAGKNASSFEVVFAEGVTRIPAYIFATNSPKQNDIYAHVTKVTIPNSVTEIGAKAFYCCYGLKDIVWGNSVKKIEGEAFAGCQGITELVLPATVELIDFRAFKECTSLAKLVVNSKCTFGSAAFGNCVALTDVTLNKGGSLGGLTFADDTKLSKLTINGDITDCDERVITVQDSWYSEFYNAGKNASSFEVVFGTGVTRIPARIFATNSEKQADVYAHITKVSIPVTTETIGKDCFRCCYGLKNIYFEGTEARWKTLIDNNRIIDEELLKDINVEFGGKPYAKGEVVESETHEITYEGLEDSKLAEGVTLPSSFEWKKKKMQNVKLPTAKQITREGYKFLGWYYTNDKGKEKKLTKITKSIKTDLKLTAKWKENTYNVVYKMTKPNGVKKCEFSLKPEKVKKAAYTSTLRLPTGITCTDKVTGQVYTLEKWTTTTPKLVGQDYEPGQSIEKFAGQEKSGKTVKLYPVWK